MNQEEILQEVDGILRGFGKEKYLKKGESVAEAEQRQCGSLVVLLGLISEHGARYEVVLKAGRRLLAKGKPSYVLRLLDTLQGIKIDRRDLYVQGRYLHHVSHCFLLSDRDRFFHNKQTIQGYLSHLKEITSCMALLFDTDEAHYHVIYNGTVYLFDLCRTLLKHGFAKEAVVFLAFAAQSCECTLLAQVKYLQWRVRLFLTIGIGYEAMQDIDGAATAVQHGLTHVQELLALEQSDAVPPSAATLATIQQSSVDLQSSLFKYAVVKVDTSSSEETTGAPPVKGKGAPSASITADSLKALLETTVPDASPLQHAKALLVAASAESLQGTVTVSRQTATLLLGLVEPILENVNGDGTERDFSSLVSCFCSLLYGYEEWDLFQKWCPRAVMDPTLELQQVLGTIKQNEEGGGVLWECVKAKNILLSGGVSDIVVIEGGLYLYKVLTKGGDDLVIKELSGDGFLVLEAVLTAMVGVGYFDVIFLTGLALATVRWCEAEAAKCEGTERRAYLQRPQKYLKPLLEMVTLRRTLALHNTTTEDSLLYKTLAVRHVQLEDCSVRLQMGVGICDLHQRIRRQHKSRLEILRTRKEQTHIFGGLSAKEVSVMRHEEKQSILPPVINTEVEQRILQERRSDPCFTAVAQIVISGFREDVKEAHKCLERAQDTIEAIGDSVVRNMLWAMLARKSLELKHYALVAVVSDVLRSQYVHVAERTLESSDIPATPIWAASPLSLDVLNMDAITLIPTPLVEEVAAAFIAAADAKSLCETLPHLYNDDPDQGFDPCRYRVVAVQWSRLSSASMLMIAFLLGSTTKYESLIVGCCHKLYNSLIPLLKTAAQHPCLLRPLWCMLQGLSTLKGSFISTPSYQSLVIRILHDLLMCCRGLKDVSGLSKACLVLFREAWLSVKANPVPHIKQRMAKRVKYKTLLKLDNNEDAEKAPAKKAPAKDKGEVQGSLNLVPDLTPSVEDTMPLEYMELLDILILEFPEMAAHMLTLHEEQAWLPPIYATVAATIRTSPQQAFDDLQAHKADPLYPKLVCLVLSVCLQTRQPKVISLIETALHALTERKKALQTLQESVISPLEATLQGLKGGESNSGAPPAKGAKKKSAGEPEGDVTKEKKSEAMMKWACLTMIKKKLLLVLRDLRIQVSISDTPYRAKLNEMAGVVYFELAEEKKAENGRENPDAPMTEEHWVNEVQCVRSLSRSMVLYARLERWKQVYATMIALMNAVHALFPGIKPILALPASATSSEPTQQPLPGLAPYIDTTKVQGKDGIAQCVKDIRSAFVQVVNLCEGLCCGTIDFSLFLDTIGFAGVEASYSVLDIHKRLSTAAVLRVCSLSKGAAALAEALQTDSIAALTTASQQLSPQEFSARSQIEQEQEEDRIKITQQSQPATPKETDQADTDQKDKVCNIQRVGGLQYCTVRTAEDLDSVLTCAMAGTGGHFRLVTAFPSNMYDALSGVVVNVAEVAELTRTKHQNGELMIGMCTAPRKVAAAMQALKFCDATISSAAEKVKGRRSICVSDFEKCNYSLVLHNIHSGQDIKGPDADGEIGVDCYLKYIVVAPKQGGLLKKRETAAEAQRAISDGVLQSLDDLPARLGSVSLDCLLDFTQMCMTVMQYGKEFSSHPAAAVYGERINSLFLGKYAGKLIPLVMSYQAAVGRTMKENAEVMLEVHRDTPRAVALVRGAEIALESYKASTAWEQVAIEVAKEREGKGGRATTIASTSKFSRSTGGGKRSFLKNEYYREVSARYTAAYSFLRQKHLTLPAMNVVSVFGQFHKDHMQSKDAARCWQDGVDIAFSAVNTWQRWRTLTEEVPGEPSLLSRLGTLRILLSIVLLYKLASQSLVTHQAAASEHCLFAAKLCKIVVSGCLSQPIREYDFCRHSVKEVLIDADVFSGPLGVDGKQLVYALAYITDYCQKIGNSLMSLPAAALMEVVAAETIRSVEYVILARCLRARAAAEIGNFEASSETLLSILRGVDLPDAALQQLGLVPASTDVATVPSSSEAKKPAAKKGAKPIEVLEVTPAKGLTNSRPLSPRDKTILEDISDKLPQRVFVSLNPALARFFYLTQVMVLQQLASSNPYMSQTLKKQPPDEAPVREAYATALGLADNLLSAVEQGLQAVEGVGTTCTRTHRCRVMYLRARACVIRGDYVGAEEVLSELLAFCTRSHELPFTQEDTEVFVSSIYVSEVTSWLVCKAWVLARQRKMGAALQMCNRCEEFCLKYEYTRGERDAKVQKAEILTMLGKHSEAMRLLTQTQGQKDVSDEGGNDDGVPDLGPLARVSAPTRLRTAPDQHAPLVEGGGLLEGMPVDVLQVDHIYTLVRFEKKQGFMLTADLRPGIVAQPRRQPEAPPRLSVVEEATALDHDARDTFLARLLLQSAAALYHEGVQGKLDTVVSRVYTAGLDTDISRYTTRAMELYKRHLQHIGVSSDLQETWKGLFNCNVPVAREACMAFVLGGHEHMKRGDLKTSEECYSEAVRISEQCCEAMQHCKAVSQYYLHRCKRIQLLGGKGDGWGISETNSIQAMPQEEALESLPDVHKESVRCLMEAIHTEVMKGVHDYTLIRGCLLEMAYFFGSIRKTVPTAMHCVLLACEVTKMLQGLSTPQLQGSPLTTLACKEKTNTVKDPDPEQLSASLRASIEEVQRRSGTAQMSFSKEYQSEVKTGPLKAQYMAQWHNAALQLLPSVAVRGETLEVELMVLRRYLQSAGSEVIWTEASPPIAGKLLDFSGVVEDFIASQVYGGSDVLQPPKKVKPGEKVDDLSPLPPVVWVVCAGCVGGPLPTPKGDGKKKNSLTQPPPSASPDVDVFVAKMLEVDQREFRSVGKVARDMRSVLSRILEREDELQCAAGEDKGSPVNKKGKEASANATPVFADTEDIVQMEAELDILKISFAEALQKILPDTEMRHLYPPITAQPGRAAASYAMAVILVQLFSLSYSGGFSCRSVNSEPAAKEASSWLLKAVRGQRCE